MTQQSLAPLLAANKVLDEIIAIASTHQSLDQFTHDRLERAAKSSIPIDAAFSYATLGALEAVSGNEELMDSYHINSIQLCNNALMHRNYAGSLHHVSRVREAAEQAQIAASLAEGDIEEVRSAIRFTEQCGGITMATSFVDTYKKLAPTDTGAYTNLIKAALVQKTVGITDEEIMQLVQIACDLLRSKQTHFVDQELVVDEEDEGFISLCINLNLTNEEIWDFNRQLFETMLDRVPKQSPYLSVRFGRNNIA